LFFSKKSKISFEPFFSLFFVVVFLFVKRHSKTHDLVFETALMSSSFFWMFLGGVCFLLASWLLLVLGCDTPLDETVRITGYAAWTQSRSNIHERKDATQMLPNPSEPLPVQASWVFKLAVRTLPTSMWQTIRLRAMVNELPNTIWQYYVQHGAGAALEDFKPLLDWAKHNQTILGWNAPHVLPTINHWDKTDYNSSTEARTQRISDEIQWFGQLRNPVARASLLMTPYGSWTKGAPGIAYHSAKGQLLRQQNLAYALDTRLTRPGVWHCFGCVVL
jgi:hypothetical protein